MLLHMNSVVCVNDNNSRCVSQVGGRVHVSKL